MNFKIEKPEAVLFDMDGSLVDSMWMWKQIDIDFLEERGLDYSPDFHQEIEGMSYAETVSYFKKKFKPEESEEELAAILNHMASDKYEFEVKWKPGALDFLKCCAEHNIPCGIATSNSKELVEACNRNLNLRKWIRSIRTADEVQKSKPFPDIYLKVAEDLNVDPAKCLVFEDVIPGIMAGKNAGMKVIAVQDDYSKDVENEKREAADGFISDYRELLMD
ncbi:haloacid dehalogenase superfamily, subfamily IA, variant 3 with third motif having DD or ED [Lachnospiraceae bacterium]|nr:haloacid dehalogenase superfamily, subfamily IA, variant 3 with third motif having DD or ED [Lachnospiraceae bacterium]